MCSYIVCIHKQKYTCHVKDNVFYYWHNTDVAVDAAANAAITVAVADKQLRVLRIGWMAIRV